MLKTVTSFIRTMHMLRNMHETHMQTHIHTQMHCYTLHTKEKPRAQIQENWLEKFSWETSMQTFFSLKHKQKLSLPLKAIFCQSHYLRESLKTKTKEQKLWEKNQIHNYEIQQLSTLWKD